MAPAQPRRMGTPLRAVAAYGLSLVFVFTGLGHLIETEVALVTYLTAVVEWALALGFFIPETRRSAGWMAIAVLVALFAASIYAAGSFTVDLLQRGLLELAIVLWAYGFTIREPRAIQLHDAVLQHG